MKEDEKVRMVGRNEEKRGKEESKRERKESRQK